MYLKVNCPGFLHYTIQVYSSVNDLPQSGSNHPAISVRLDPTRVNPIHMGTGPRQGRSVESSEEGLGRQYKFHVV